LENANSAISQPLSRRSPPKDGTTDPWYDKTEARNTLFKLFPEFSVFGFYVALTPFNVMDLHTLNENYISTASIGLQAILGLEGLPINRIILAYGKPHTGKSTLFFHVAADLDKLNMAAALNGAAGKEETPPHKVVVIETENKIDNIYLASFFAHRTDALRRNGATDPEVDLTVLQYHHRNHKQMVRQIENLHKKGKYAHTYCSPAQLLAEKAKQAKMEVLIKLLKTSQYPYPSDEIVLEQDKDNRPTIQKAKKLLRDAYADYRLQNVHLYQHIHSLDELEQFIFLKFVQPARENPRLREQHVFLVVDTLSELPPESEYKKALSTDGNIFGMASYLSKWVAKLPKYMLEANITLAFVAQETTNLAKAINIYAPTDPVMDGSFKGGTKIRYASSLMIEIKRAKEVTMLNGTTAKAAQIVLPKDSLIRGAKAERKGTFYIVQNENSHRLEFDEPFFLNWCATAPQTDPQTGVFHNRKNIGIPLRFIQDQIDTLPEKTREEIFKLIKALREHVKLKGSAAEEANSDSAQELAETNGPNPGSLLAHLANLADTFATPDNDSQDSNGNKMKTPTEPVGWDPETLYLFSTPEVVLPFVIGSPYIRQVVLDNRLISTHRY
jgi:RecA/RadA recombinase